jgi:hypothetical protein
MLRTLRWVFHSQYLDRFALISRVNIHLPSSPSSQPPEATMTETPYLSLVRHYFNVYFANPSARVLDVGPQGRLTAWLRGMMPLTRNSSNTDARIARENSNRVLYDSSHHHFPCQLMLTGRSQCMVPIIKCSLVGSICQHHALLQWTYMGKGENSLRIASEYPVPPFRSLTNDSATSMTRLI